MYELASKIKATEQGAIHVNIGNNNWRAHGVLATEQLDLAPTIDEGTAHVGQGGAVDGDAKGAHSHGAGGRAMKRPQWWMVVYNQRIVLNRSNRGRYPCMLEELGGWYVGGCAVAMQQRRAVDFVRGIAR